MGISSKVKSQIKCHAIPLRIIRLTLFAVEYPIIGAVGGLICVSLTLLTAHAKCCAPAPDDRYLPHDAYRRDGATTAPLIK